MNRRSFLTSIMALPMLPVTATWAYHEANEPSDGTVRSFIKVDPPRVLDPFTFNDGQGREVSLADFQGKIVLMNMWATWCAPCLRELPALDRLQGKLGGSDFTVLPVSLDQVDPLKVASFYRRLKIVNLGLYLDQRHQSARVLPIDVLPASFFLDRQGRIISYLRSYADWDAPEAADLIRSLIAAPS